MTNKSTKEMFGDFWFIHVKPTIDHSKALAKKYKANTETVWLSAILHDIARLDDKEPHDEIGSEKAHRMLLGEGFSEEIAEKVRNTILTHSCKKHKPKTLEQKILATADALVHFKTPFYLWFSYISNKSFTDNLESGLRKIKKDYNDKIFFKEEKKLIKKEYKILKNWFKQH